MISEVWASTVLQGIGRASHELMTVVIIYCKICSTLPEGKKTALVKRQAFKVRPILLNTSNNACFPSYSRSFHINE